jgi:hypothetical protein
MRGRRGIPGVIEDSLPAAALDKAQMSAKFGEMGEQVYVEAEKVKERVTGCCEARSQACIIAAPRKIA